MERTATAPTREWPSLAGLGADYIAEQLQNFKDGKRNNPIMQPMAAPLSARTWPDLGAYFDTPDEHRIGSGSRPLAGRAKSSIEAATRRAAFRPAWPATAPSGAGNEPAKFPALRGQQSVYVTKQLNAYAAGTRPPGPGGIMADHRQASVGRRHPQSLLLYAGTSLTCAPQYRFAAECGAGARGSAASINRHRRSPHRRHRPGPSSSSGKRRRAAPRHPCRDRRRRRPRSSTATDRKPSRMRPVTAARTTCCWRRSPRPWRRRLRPQPRS